LSLTKCRVFDPIVLVRYVFQGVFYWKVLVKAWLYGWHQILFGRRLKLWVPVPGIATHLDAKALSPNVNWVALIEQGIEVKV